MRRILICTPLVGGLPPTYFQGLVSALLSKSPDVNIDYCFIGGTGVQWARDECAHYLLTGKGPDGSAFDELIFWDKDLQPHPSQVAKLIAYNVPVICGVYAKRGLPTYWHLDMKPDQPPREDGLVVANRCAIGFSKIKREVFETLKAKNPQRAYKKQDGGADEVALHEFFPMGITGPNSAEGKLARIRAAVNGTEEYDLGLKVIEILNDSDYATNRVLGEDFYFCELCNAAGIPVLADPSLVINHRGEITYPIPTPDLMKEVTQPWRKEEVERLTAQLNGQTQVVNGQELGQFQK